MSGCISHQLAPAFGCSACDARARQPVVATSLDIAELRNMIRNLQLSVARIEAALEKKGKP